MANVILFHHALGLTPGLRAIGAVLEASGHHVETPDLFDGATFPTIDEGVAHAKSIGFEVIAERGVVAAESTSDAFATIGFSLGVVPAQQLAQTHPGVSGAILVAGALPLNAFGEQWPSEVGLQIHLVEQDPWVEEDLPAARDLSEAANGELFLYPGSGHIVADPSCDDYEPTLAELIIARMTAFLERLEPGG